MRYYRPTKPVPVEDLMWADKDSHRSEIVWGWLDESIDVETLDFVFQGESPHLTFVEVENQDGESVRVGEWLTREDGTQVLRVRAVGGEGERA